MIFPRGTEVEVRVGVHKALRAHGARQTNAEILRQGRRNGSCRGMATRHDAFYPGKIMGHLWKNPWFSRE